MKRGFFFALISRFFDSMNKILFLFFLPFSLLAQTASVFHDIDKKELIALMQDEGVWKQADTNALQQSTLQYVTAAAKAQKAYISHQQGLGAYMNIGLELEKYGQEGQFNKADAKYYDFNAAFSFQNKQQNYFLNTVLTYQKYDFAENGGLVDYEKGLYNDLMLYPIQLSSARNSGKHRGVSLQQDYLLNEQWRLRHAWSRWRKAKTYSDDDPFSGYYTAVYLDSTQTLDSTYTEKNKHCFGIVNDYKWSFSYLLQRERYFDISTDTNRLYHGLGLDYRSVFLGGNLLFEGQLLTEGNYAAQASFSREKKSNYKLELNLLREDVPLSNQYHSSNHFRWNKQLAAIESQSLFLHASRGIFTFESTFNRTEQYVYWDENAFIQQWEVPNYHMQSVVRLDWKWRKWSGKQQLRYQKVSELSIQPIPEWHAQSTLYYESPFFDAAMTARLGFDVDYFTAYYAMAYMPALGQMHLQNEVLIGDYPLLTAFLETQIQSATIRVQARNVSDLFLEEAHFVLPGYPYPPMAIELGLRWGLN